MKRKKQFLLDEVPANIKPLDLKEKNGVLEIKWPDNHLSSIPIDKIIQSTKPRYPMSKTWEEDFNPQKFDWTKFLAKSNLTVKAIEEFLKSGVIILSNAPDTPYSLEKLSAILGPLHETLFERIHNVSVTGHVYNVAHTSKGLPPHNDFASYKYQPSVQALHMLINECEGGESIIVDGHHLASDLREDCKEYFEILQTFQVPFREFDENNETYAEAPIIKCASDGSIESFRFSNQLMQMINPNKENLELFYEAYHEVCKRVRLKKYRRTFRLNSGEVLIVASLRVLHARESFKPNGKRHLQDAYFVYDNVANNLIILKNK